VGGGGDAGWGDAGGGSGADRVHVASFAELTPLTLYRILRLRSSVFSVEQACAYNDLDGRDIEAATLHLWFDIDPAGPTVTAALRLLTQPDGSHKLGRVVTAPSSRGQGRAGALLDRAMTIVAGDAAVTLDAQCRLEPWYARWGFVRCGADFDEDGIAHTPMRRPSHYGPAPHPVTAPTTSGTPAPGEWPLAGGIST